MDRFFVRRHLGDPRLKQLVNSFVAMPVKQVLHGRLVTINILRRRHEIAYIVLVITVECLKSSGLLSRMYSLAVAQLK